MSELNYSKKLIQPLIDKYAINAETNTTFARIIRMFDGKPNYQLWGVKVVFSKAVKIEELEVFYDWAKNNPAMIKLLTKNGNLICYVTKADFASLRNEFDGLTKITFVKNTISIFNTAQRKILTEVIQPDKFNGITCQQNETFLHWFDLLNKFFRLSPGTKTKVIGRMSAVKDIKGIEVGIVNALKDKYAWNKEDLLSFVANNTPACDVIVNDKDVVIIDVKNYKDANTLCYGRTNWCITSSEGQWDNYVRNRKGNRQYFLFDFSKNEKDELAHIGFTVGDKGFYAAHSNTDQNLMERGMSYHGSYVNIQQALEKAGVELGLFLKFKNNPYYTWDAESLIKFVEKNSSDLAIAYNENNRVIVNALTNKGLSMLCNHSFIKCENMPIDNRSKCYVLIDFNLPNNNSKCIVAIYYKKDKYDIDTLNNVWDAYGACIRDDKYISKIGITTDSYLNREAINPNIMLHKLIDEGDEEGAIALIDKEKAVDVNFEFNDRRPVFCAIESKMFKLLGKIISNDGFDSNVDDGLGESIIQSLLYSYYLSETNKLTPDVEKNVRVLIETLIDSGKFDLNFIDFNDDTLINIACTNPNMGWLVEKLAARRDVNVNQINDIGWTALGNALRNNNKVALTIIGKREDLVVTANDRELAKSKNIDLNKFLKPEPFKEVTEKMVTYDVTSAIEDVDKYNEIFEKVFSASKHS